ncbi:hypothetical protein P879_02766 [Paragonimus westermani]|uniref:Uncharacterized protein n=1 Tax=Paragonimus westermani TaxID=34504 RepID=A0A8T0DWK2_9TREM|nr:hypothetical protein P879_02766 [Paragonimus westermani]
MDCERTEIVTAQRTNRPKSNTANLIEYRSNGTRSYEAIRSLQGEPNRAFLLRALACRNSHPVNSSSPIAQSCTSRTSSVILLHSHENSADQSRSVENSIKPINPTSIPTHYDSRIRTAFGEVHAIMECNAATQAKPNRSTEIGRSVTTLSPYFGQHQTIRQPSSIWYVSPPTSNDQPRSEMIKLPVSVGRDYAEANKANFHSTYSPNRRMNVVEKLDTCKPDRLNKFSPAESTEKSTNKLPKAHIASVKMNAPVEDKSGSCTLILESQSGQRISCNKPHNWSSRTMQEKATQTNVENSVQHTETVINPDQKSGTCEVELQCRLPFSNQKIGTYKKTISSAEGWRHIPFTNKLCSIAGGKKKLSLQTFIRCIRGDTILPKRTRWHAQATQDYDPTESKTRLRCSKRTRRLMPSDVYINSGQLRNIRRRLAGLNKQHCRGVEAIESRFALIHDSLGTLASQVQAIVVVLNEQNGLVQGMTRAMETLPAIWTTITASKHTIRRRPSSSSLIQRYHSTMSKSSTEQPSGMNPKLTRSEYSIHDRPVRSSLHQKSNPSHSVQKRSSFVQRPTSVSTQRAGLKKIVNQPEQLQPITSSEECTLITECINEKHSDDSSITANNPLQVTLTRIRNNSITFTGKSALPTKGISENTVSYHDKVDECRFDINPTDFVSSSPTNQCSSPPTLLNVIEGPPSKSVTHTSELQRYYRIAYEEPEKRSSPQNPKGTNQKSVRYGQESYGSKTNQKDVQTFYKTTAAKQKETGQLITACKRSEKSPTRHSQYKETIGKIHKSQWTTTCPQKVKAETGSLTRIRRCKRTSTQLLGTTSNSSGEQKIPSRPST